MNLFFQDSNVPVVVLHVGTNDASTRDRTRKICDIIDDFEDLFLLCKDKFPNAVICYSEILPRWDADNKRAQQVNQEMRQLVKKFDIKYIETWSQFDKVRKFYKYTPNRFCFFQICFFNSLFLVTKMKVCADKPATYMEQGISNFIK